MAIPNTVNFGDPRREHALTAPLAETASASSSAVSWSAIFAGAAGAAALSLILLMLGTGLGLSSVSPWVQDGIDQASFGTVAIAWVTFTQVLASGMGGYLAGRLRTRWVDVQRDEVHFRDTAHGFLAWAVASLATAVLLTQVVGSITQPSLQTRLAQSNNIVLTQQETAVIDRQAPAHAALWVFVALLSGAFVASLAATVGGRQRDA